MTRSFRKAALSHRAATPARSLARRLALPVALLGLAAGCWLPRAAVAQEMHGPSGAAAPTQAAPAGSAPTQPNTSTAEPGAGPSQPGTTAVTTPQDPRDPVGELPHSGGPIRHDVAGPGGERQAEKKEEKEEFELHLPTWLYAPLKVIWHSGPATLTADGAVDANGQPVAGADLIGKQVDYVGPEGPGAHKEELKLHPTIGAIGNSQPQPGQELRHISVDGREISLVNAQVKFAYQSAFPEHLAMSLTTAIVLFLVLFALTRNMKRVPGRMQSVLEMGYQGLDGFVGGIIGPGYERYVPLIGTLFIYIFFMNIGVMIPGWGSATANINVTAGLALVIFVYVQYRGIRVNGIGGYLKHFVGEPVWLAPLNFPLHVIGEFAKLLSLSLRLFGNIFGEDTVIVILIGLMAMFKIPWFPAQVLMYPLSLFAGVVQAMVFCLLTCIYIAMMTAHDDHGDDHGGHGHNDHGHSHDGPDHGHSHAHA